MPLVKGLQGPRDFSLSGEWIPHFRRQCWGSELPALMLNLSTLLHEKSLIRWILVRMLPFLR